MGTTHNELPSFSFVAGRGHGPETWRYVQEELKTAGVRSIAPDLPIEDKDCSLDDHARILTEAEAQSGLTRINRVGWSWGANVIPRLVGITAVEGLIFTGGKFDPSTLGTAPSGKNSDPEHSIIYSVLSQYVDERRPGWEQLAEDALYHDVSPKSLVREIIRGRRKHPRRDGLEPILPQLPDLPMDFLVLTKDKAVLPDAEREMAAKIGATVHEFESGHAPMYSQPQKLAAKLIEIAQKKTSYTPRPEVLQGQAL